MEPIPLHHVWTYTDVDRCFWNEHLEDWLPKKIFDAHTHISHPKHRLESITDEMRKQYWVNEVNEPIDADTASHCIKTVFPGRDVAVLALGWPGLDFDIDASNEYVRTQCLKRHWPCLAVSKPQLTAAQLAQQLDKPGVIGVKPYYSLISYNPVSRDQHIEASIFDFLPHHQLELLNERGSWVTLHVPKADRLGHPANIAEIKEIRRKYPNIILIIAHLGRCYTLPHAQEALVHFADDDGLYFDNSAVLNPQVHRFALELLGPRRILYGTDNPIFYMRGRRVWRDRTYINHTDYPFYFNKNREPAEVEASYTLYMYEALKAIRFAATELNFGRAEIEAIFHDNAAALIKRATASSKS